MVQTAAIAPWTETLFDELKNLWGDRFTTSAAVREHHGKDESYHPPFAPDAVCFPISTDEIAAVVKACACANMPVIPFGAGTSLEGHVIAVSPGSPWQNGVAERFIGTLRRECLDHMVIFGEALSLS